MKVSLKTGERRKKRKDICRQKHASEKNAWLFKKKNTVENKQMDLAKEINFQRDF